MKYSTHIHRLIPHIALACLAFSHSGYAACPEICDTARDNTGVGESVFIRNPTGFDNSAFGANAMQELTSGLSNTGVGSGALVFNETGDYNTAVGVSALANNKVDDNTAVGWSAMNNNTTGIQNTALGSQALLFNQSGNSNTATGWGALNRNGTASYNTATGAEALYYNTGEFNAGHGTRTLYSNTTGTSNTADGYAAMYYNTGGNFNAAVGFDALSSNTTGSNNVAVGRSAGVNLTTGSNNIVIGANVPGKTGEANKIRIGKQGTQNGTFIAGIYNINEPAASGIKPVYVNSTGQLGTMPPASSARFKEAIKPMDRASEAILGLKPVTFRYKDDDEDRPQFGLIAEEVAKVDPNLVIRDEEGRIYTVRYEAVNAMLLNEFLKEREKVQKLEAALAAVNQRLKDQDARVQAVNDKLEIDPAHIANGCYPLIRPGG